MYSKYITHRKHTRAAAVIPADQTEGDGRESRRDGEREKPLKSLVPDLICVKLPELRVENKYLHTV